MNKKRKNQHGFSIFEVLIVLVALAFLGLAGWKVYQSQSDKSTDSGESLTDLHSGQSEPKFDSAGVPTDPIGDPKGPFYHDLYIATSSDGLNFSGSAKLLEHASVPDIIRLPDGRIAVYAVEAAQRSKSGLLVSISKDEGKTWKTGSVRFTDAQPGLGGADPEVVLTDDGKIRLYMVSFGGGPAQNSMPDPNTKNQIKSAISDDGITFTLEDGNRFEYSQMTDPDIVKIGGKWFGYISQGPKDIAISSADGLSFSLEKTIRTNGSVSNTVPIGGGKFRQFYCSGGIKSATTTDGLTFTDETGSRIADAPNNGGIICDPAPLQVGDSWLMVYKAAKQ